MNAAIYALIIALLVAVPYPADAECAWALWGRVEDRPNYGIKGWFARGMFDTRTACIAPYDTYLRDMQRLGWEVIGGQARITRPAWER